MAGGNSGSTLISRINRMSDIDRNNAFISWLMREGISLGSAVRAAVHREWW